MNADKNKEKASRLLIATRAKYRNNCFTNKRGSKTTNKLFKNTYVTIISYLKIKAIRRGKGKQVEEINISERCRQATITHTSEITHTTNINATHPH